MKVVQINSTCGAGSTGKICVGISKLMTSSDIENHILYSARSSGYPLGIRCSTNREIRMQALKSRLSGNYGFNSRKATRKMISELERLSPDIVHLHNIHGHDCDTEMLFSYFKEHHTKLIWTFHDCWAFTGYCTYYTMTGCEKWKQGCRNCVKRRDHSLLFDRSKELYERKKRLFSGLDLTIVTPSEWLADQVRESFLKDYPLKVINNGIDLSVFRPVESDFRRKNGVEDKKLVLGVALFWEPKKGMDVFIELAHRLSDDYRIILVGTNDAVDRRLPDNVISIHRTQNQQELAEIYTAADVFVNPTREENYPTVNMEALACGTPVITFRTGGSPEILDESCGSVVQCDDTDALEKEIIRVCTDRPYTEEQCLSHSRAFDEKERMKEYIRLYERINARRDEGDRI